MTERQALALFDRLRFVAPRASARKGGGFHPQIAALSSERVSGVYVIEREGVIVYVGSAKRGTLYGTLTRHFQRWDRTKRGAKTRRALGEDDATGARARSLEGRWIVAFDPVENRNVPGGRPSEELPF